MSAPKVATIILNWNGLDDTKECLESLKKLTYENYEVVVVDNGSAGNDVAVLRDMFGDYIHIVENSKNCGFAEGSNIGIRYALTNFTPDYVMLLNNDTVVDPEMLTELVKAAEGNANVGLVGPQIYPYSIRNTESTRGDTAGQSFKQSLPLVDMVELTLLFKICLQSGIREENPTLIWLNGCALLIKTTVIEKIGFLYSGYFAYYEETEYCLRCVKAGFRLILVPTALLWHKGGATTGKVAGFSQYFMTRNQFLLVARNSDLRGLLLYLLYFISLRGPLTAFYYFLRNDPRSLTTFCKAAFAGLKSLLTKQQR